MYTIRENVIMDRNAGWNGKRVVVIGAARQGTALARYFLRQGAKVVINDRLPLERLVSAQKELAGEPVEWIAGSHPLSMLAGADLLCISGGVPFNLPIVREAQNRGIKISNDSQIFLEVCPCRVIGITGSAGKTTTTTLVGLIAQAAIDELLVELNQPEVSDFHGLSNFDSLSAESKVWVGGNIGSPLISWVEQMRPADIVVMELSSFQLEVMQRSPEIAAVLNITPNHLDRHESMRIYIEIKSRILAYQSSEDAAVLNRDDQESWALRNRVQGRLVSFGSQTPPDSQEGIYFDQDLDAIMIRLPSGEENPDIHVMNRDEIPLRGEHNLHNVLAACAIALAAGFSPNAMAAGVRRLTGIPHRLEFVRSWGGGDWYNDSIATAPERAIAAINSFSEPLILLAGGKDKNLPWDKFASLVSKRVRHLILFGEAAGRISAVMHKYEGDSDLVITFCSSLKEAVQTAADKVSNGDVILLSPGGTSFDEFQDFEDRGEAYKKWVMELP
ncbi:MAG: UDP-N-acetylmuramoyl-L-alanine--D-glutamate ligase [Chloroflexota bacterium]|nr:MAG: UDP-N-acetylmuramoyl-L-alanine--D-glutamate ligase [Chloroflexota bacterium]